MTEQEAHDEILRRCHATGMGKSGRHWVMRRAECFPGGLAVIDMARREPVPGGYSWEKRDLRVATGSSWVEILAALPS